MLDFKHFAGRTYLLGATIGLATLAGVAGCKSDAQNASNIGPDPAAANEAPVDPNQQAQLAQPVQQYPATSQGAVSPAPRTRVLGQRQVNESQQQAEAYQQNPQQAPAPVQQQAPDPSNYVPPAQTDQNYQQPDQSYQQGDENY